MHPRGAPQTWWGNRRGQPQDRLCSRGRPVDWTRPWYVPPCDARGQPDWTRPRPPAARDDESADRIPAGVPPEDRPWAAAPRGGLADDDVEQLPYLPVFTDLAQFASNDDEAPSVMTISSLTGSSRSSASSRSSRSPSASSRTPSPDRSSSSPDSLEDGAGWHDEVEVVSLQGSADEYAGPEADVTWPFDLAPFPEVALPPLDGTQPPLHLRGGAGPTFYVAALGAKITLSLR